MIKVCFLDLDGVINSQDENHEVKWLKRGYGFYQDNLIANLNVLLERCPELKLVISSTWRLGSTVEELTDILTEMGVKNFEIIGKTPNFAYPSDQVHTVRGNEIAWYIEQNQEQLGYESCYKYKSYIILDDDSDMLYPQRNNFVHIDNEVGLTLEDVDKCLKILG